MLETELTGELMKEYLPNGGTEEEFKAIDPKQYILQTSLHAL